MKDLERWKKDSIAMADKRGDISPGWKITSSLLHYYYKISPSFRSKIFYNSPKFILFNDPRHK